MIKDKDYRYSKRAIAGFNKVTIQRLVCHENMWIPGESTRMFCTTKLIASQQHASKAGTYPGGLVSSRSRQLSSVKSQSMPKTTLDDTRWSLKLVDLGLSSSRVAQRLTLLIVHHCQTLRVAQFTGT